MSNASNIGAADGARTENGKINKARQGASAVGAYAIGLDLESIFRMNKEKLEARYPDGFSADRSLHRAENDI